MIKYKYKRAQKFKNSYIYIWKISFNACQNIDGLQNSIV